MPPSRSVTRSAGWRSSFSLRQEWPQRKTILISRSGGVSRGASIKLHGNVVHHTPHCAGATIDSLQTLSFGRSLAIGKREQERVRPERREPRDIARIQGGV